MISAKKKIEDGKFLYLLEEDDVIAAKCFYDPTEAEIYDYEYMKELDLLSKSMLFLAVLGYFDDLGHKKAVCTCGKDENILDRLGFKKEAEDKYVLDLNGYFKSCCSGH